jgi:hypothetical protein
VDDLLQEAIALWRDSPERLPESSRIFSLEEQQEREADLDRLLAGIQEELRRVPATRAERMAAWERINAAFHRFAISTPGLRQRHLDILFGGGLSSIGTVLARRARRFDDAVSTSDIFQASRNAWAACGLQMLLGQPMSLTPAIFAYSMLYPYTDNYLDDPLIPREAKAGFNGRFGERLAGGRPAPANQHETFLWRLVAMIEEQYDRTVHPQIFESLQRIQRAQANSLLLLRQGEPDVVSLCFEKGGSSVLADGYLAAGSMEPVEARFVFFWGVLLQLADDLQDVRGDKAAGALTLFSQAAGRTPLDMLTSRLLQFGGGVLGLMPLLPRASNVAIKELIAHSSVSLIIRSAGEEDEWFTPAYLEQLEVRSPFRFAFLRDRRRRLSDRRAQIARLFEAFLEGDEDEPGFPLLPHSLTPA